MIYLYNTLLKKKNRLFPRSHADSADGKCGAFGGKPSVTRFRKRSENGVLIKDWNFDTGVDEDRLEFWV